MKKALNSVHKFLLIKKTIASLLVLSTLLLACTESQKKADRIYYNATIWTGDSTLPAATTIAVSGNEIIYVGDNYKDFQGPETELIDVNEGMIVPGFIDNHTHFLTGGYNLASVDLRIAKSKEEFIQILGTFCAQHPDDRWVLGGDWDHEAWGGELPSKEWIDSVTGNQNCSCDQYQ